MATLPLIISVTLSLAGILSAGHALLNKRDPRSALGWVVFCLMFPGVGAGFYWIAGVNRIQTRAQRWRRKGKWRFEPSSACASPDFEREQLAAIVRVSDKVTRRPLLGGNRVQPLHNGDQAYPAMLAAILAARERVYLSTYIFRTDRVGRQFIGALGDAARRGVDVLVLLDGLGELYSFPLAGRALRRAGVRVGRFLPLGTGLHLNLRNHRKLLIVDSTVGFTGGMNIDGRNLAEGTAQADRIVDLHFIVEGPVVVELEDAFLEDWYFATGEEGADLAPRAPLSPGRTYGRGISAGPNEDFEKLYWIILGAVNAARERLRIMTPYFIPDRALLTTLKTAALRGVCVELILPARNNLLFVAWAMRAFLWEMAEHGARVYYQPPPFTHSKLLVVDECYTLVGSANLDPRSLRLNFEFNLEVYEDIFAAEMAKHFDAVRDRSHEVTLAELENRRIPERLRDAAAKLAAPYL